MSLSPPDPTPYYLWGGISLFLVLLIWRGWRLGLARQLADLVGLVCGGIAGYFCGPFVAPLLGSLGFPKQILQMLGGAFVGLTIYLAVMICAAVFLKKTAQQSFGPIRLVFGFGGALLALITGLIFVGSSLIALRFYGNLVEPGVARRGHGSAEQGVTRGSWFGDVVKLKRAVEEGIPGFFFRKADPVSDSTYETAQKMGAVIVNPRAMERFLSFPNVRPLALHPKVLALQNDPEIQRAAERRDYLAILRNPHLVQAANDPEIARLVRTLDFRKALDYALAPGGGAR